MSLIFKVGRPTNLTPELIEHLVAAIPQAITQNQLSRLTGVPQKCISEWLVRGKDDREKSEDSIYAQFSLKYDEKKAEIIQQLLFKMMGLDSFQSTQWMLEQCWPEEFGLNSPIIKALMEEINKVNKLHRGEAL